VAGLALVGYLYPDATSHTRGAVVKTPTVLFLCTHNAGRSQMAMGFVKHLAGAWRKIYAVTATVALYLNVFVLIAQLFMKVPALHAMAPNGSEPPFLVTQCVVLVLFVVLTIAAAIKFRPEPLNA
jgi:hypothetical protein